MPELVRATEEDVENETTSDDGNGEQVAANKAAPKKAVKKAAKKVTKAGAKPATAKTTVKAAGKRPTKKVATAETRVKGGKWTLPLAKYIAKHPGVNRAKLHDHFKVKDFAGALLNQKIFKSEVEQGTRGFVFTLTAEGRKLATSDK